MALSADNKDRTALAGFRFLVVDDHSYMIDVICEILRHYSAAETMRAESVEAALARIGPRVGFDCIICDFNMKPVNGLKFLQIIRTGKRPDIARDQKFVLLTGQGDIEVVKTAKALDVSGYVVKPVAADTFVKTVLRALASTLAPKPAADYERVPTHELARFQ
jgi:two-component system, chemotaxis family, chemotaxis protein CheY